jgi:hypothetical protein
MMIFVYGYLKEVVNGPTSIHNNIVSGFAQLSTDGRLKLIGELKQLVTG